MLYQSHSVSWFIFLFSRIYLFLNSQFSTESILKATSEQNGLEFHRVEPSKIRQMVSPGNHSPRSVPLRPYSTRMRKETVYCRFPPVLRPLCRSTMCVYRKRIPAHMIPYVPLLPVLFCDQFRYLKLPTKFDATATKTPGKSKYLS